MLQCLFAIGIGHAQILKFDLHGLVSFLFGFQSKDTDCTWSRFVETMCFT